MGKLVHDEYKQLIESSRVSTPTRRVLLARGQPDTRRYVPLALKVDEFATLGALLDRLLPQSSETWIDLAARIDSQLAEGEGDGWRFAILPPDVEAYRAALQTLDAGSHGEYSTSFADLAAQSQEFLLQRMMRGGLGSDGSSRRTGLLTPDQMKAWFEDLRADAARVYMAHPETLSRIGYSGIANGGDGNPKSGFVRVGIDERESWEPMAHTAPAP